MQKKQLQGYLAFHKVRFSKTHDLEILINLVAQVDIELSQRLKPAAILTKYATAYRYPEEAQSPEPLTDQNCQKIFDLANMVFDELHSKIS